MIQIKSDRSVIKQVVRGVLFSLPVILYLIMWKTIFKWMAIWHSTVVLGACFVGVIAVCKHAYEWSSQSD